MGAELGVTTSVFPSDAVTRTFLRAQGRADQWRPLRADRDAAYDRVIDIDLGTLEPLAACPSSPDQVRPVRELGDVAVGQVAIGSCTNSSLRDLLLVSRVLAGRCVHPDVSLAIAPGSRQVLEQLGACGALRRLIQAGARILETACGPCIGQGFSPASDMATVRTFNRNFAGRTGTPGDRCYLVSPETAVATALSGRLTDPRTLGPRPPALRLPRRFPLDDRMILAPPPPGTPVAIVRKDTIGKPPTCTPFPEPLDGEVLIRLGDKITTDHIMPAGAFLKHRSNIPVYARYVFHGLGEPGRPSFAERAAALRDAGRHGVIVAGESYGQGSSREHAAICPQHLGVRLVLALSIERIHAANLVNFGILPLLLAQRSDLERLGEGVRVRGERVAEQLRQGTVTLRVQAPDGHEDTLQARCLLSGEEIEELLAGGRLRLA
jgi:aconitate hydratase